MYWKGIVGEVGAIQRSPVGKRLESGRENQYRIAVVLYLLVGPEHRVIIDLAPQVCHIDIVRVIGMARLPCGMDSNRIGEVVQINHHSHRRQPINHKGCGMVPASRVDDTIAASSREWSPVKYISNEWKTAHDLIVVSGGVQ